MKVPHGSGIVQIFGPTAARGFDTVIIGSGAVTAVQDIDRDRFQLLVERIYVQPRYIENLRLTRRRQEECGGLVAIECRPLACTTYTNATRDSSATMPPTCRYLPFSRTLFYP